MREETSLPPLPLISWKQGFQARLEKKIDHVLHMLLLRSFTTSTKLKPEFWWTCLSTDRCTSTNQVGNKGCLGKKAANGIVIKKQNQHLLSEDTGAPTCLCTLMFKAWKRVDPRKMGGEIKLMLVDKSKFTFKAKEKWSWLSKATRMHTLILYISKVRPKRCSETG